MKPRNQIILLVGLVAVAAVVWFSQRTKPTAAAGTASVFQDLKLLGVESSELHFASLEAARKTEYSKTVRDIFRSVAPPPTVDPGKMADRHEPIGPQKDLPPPDPKLPGNLKFFGYGTVPNGTARRAFFSDGEDVYIVPEGETLLGRYRILKVGNLNLEFEEVATGRRGTAALEDQRTGPSA